MCVPSCASSVFTDGQSAVKVVIEVKFHSFCHSRTILRHSFLCLGRFGCRVPELQFVDVTFLFRIVRYDLYVDGTCRKFLGIERYTSSPFAIQIHPFGRKNVFSATHQYTAHALCLKAERCGCRKVSVYSRSFHLDTLHPFSFLRMVGKVFQVGNVVGRCR